MTVQQIPGEVGRFWVESRTRPGLLHTVDLGFVREGHHKSHAECSCEQCQCKNDFACAHIIACVLAEEARLGLPIRAP